jgi:NAD(P)-dependent dehydrogenase (short-subunit alcohol dehydrogenase family)
MNIAGAVVVITGGGSGIGAAMARRFAKEGARHVVVSDREEASAQAVAREIGGHAVPVDVAQEHQTRGLIDWVESHCGPIDLFCANAGITARGGVELPDEQWQRLWQVNLMAHVHAARVLVPRMTQRGRGHLLFTASAAGLLSQFDVAYAVTKHAAVALAEWLSITHGDQGLGVSCLCPLGVDTPMLRAEDDTRRELMSHGLISPDAVAAAVMHGLSADEFLILPHPEVREFMRRRAEDHPRWLRSMRRLHAQATGG